MTTSYRTRRSPLRNVLRRIRYAFRKPAWLIHEENECEFYSHFIPWNGLCFDIGANVGSKTAIFNLLGARTVAIEPVPACAESLRQRFAGQDVVVVEAAVADTEGEMTLFVGDSSTISSLRSDWIDKNPVRLTGRKQSGQVDVRVTTLDSLTREFGDPDFCKIDVEGFEPEVLRGLARPIKAIAFEWTASVPENVGDCVSQLCSLGDYRFNFTFSSPMIFQSESWLKGEQIAEAIKAEARHNPSTWGDVVAVLNETRD